MNNKDVEKFVEDVIKIETDALELKRNAELEGDYSKTNVKKIDNDVINEILNLLDAEDNDEN